MTEVMTINQLLQRSSANVLPLSAGPLELSDEDLAAIYGGTWGDAVTAATVVIAAAGVIATGGGVLVAAGAVSAGVWAATIGISAAAGAALGLGATGVVNGMH